MKLNLRLSSLLCKTVGAKISEKFVSKVIVNKWWIWWMVRNSTLEVLTELKKQDSGKVVLRRLNSIVLREKQINMHVFWLKSKYSSFYFYYWDRLGVFCPTTHRLLFASWSDTYAPQWKKFSLTIKCFTLELSCVIRKLEVRTIFTNKSIMSCVFHILSKVRS